MTASFRWHSFEHCRTAKCTSTWELLSHVFGVRITLCAVTNYLTTHTHTHTHTHVHTYIYISFVHSFIHSWIIHSVVCLVTGPQPLPKSVLHRVRSSPSSINFQYPLFSLRSSSSCLRLSLRLPFTPIIHYNFPSIIGFRRQFLRKMWPVQLAFLLFTVCGTFLSSLTLCNTSSFFTRSVQLIFNIFLQKLSLKLSRYFWSAFLSVRNTCMHKDVI